VCLTWYAHVKMGLLQTLLLYSKMAGVSVERTCPHLDERVLVGPEGAVGVWGLTKPLHCQNTSFSNTSQAQHLLVTCVCILAPWGDGGASPPAPSCVYCIPVGAILATPDSRGLHSTARRTKIKQAGCQVASPATPAPSCVTGSR
jgi:hypothetical protein